MAEQRGIDKINGFKQRWISYQLLSIVISAAALSLLIGTALHAIFGLSSVYGILIFVFYSGGLLFWHQPWKITDTDVARFLNTVDPDLEESCELVIQPINGNNLLQNLQRQKVEQVLSATVEPKQFTQRFKTAIMLMLAAMLLSFFIDKINFHHLSASLNSSSSRVTKNLVPEKLLPQIESVNVSIVPPAYTSKLSREQQRFNLNVEDGSHVNWVINTNTAVKQVQFVFNEKELVNLHPTNTQKTTWQVQKQFTAPGFYQVKINGKLSDYYQIEIIKDTPPVIRIKTPKQYTYIDAGESTKVPLSVNLTDDYGISDAFIYATIAKGSGEAVKFKEQKLTFAESFSAKAKGYQLNKILDLKTLTLEPGDELYFYIQAQDTHQQQSRTDVYIISVQDTAQLLSMNQMTMGVSQVPEYFRSERQIILDTEKLLKDRDSISAERFKSRCNDLGMDQKLLRLRYGKFLGEEEESSEGGLKGAESLAAPEDFSNTQKIMDAYQDKHDNAEDAGFFEKDTKAQLKNTLNEMWKAELNLRIFKPNEALPFEYKALRLLKDLQQKSRAYVAKTAFKPPTLKLVEKRLSGDLSKVIQPLSKQDIKTNDDINQNLKKAISVLDEMKHNLTVPASGQNTLQTAGLQLNLKATSQPNLYLSAVTAMHHILNANGKVTLNDILKVEAALNKALPNTAKIPQANQNSPDMGLSQSYYKNLIHTNK